MDLLEFNGKFERAPIYPEDLAILCYVDAFETIKRISIEIVGRIIENFCRQWSNKKNALIIFKPRANADSCVETSLSIYLLSVSFGCRTYTINKWSLKRFVQFKNYASEEKQSRMDKHVIIIGAGAAGIAAATKLILNGFRNIVILEGQSRIGGRIHTIPFNDSVLDVGAQW